MTDLQGALALLEQKARKTQGSAYLMGKVGEAYDDLGREVRAEFEHDITVLAAACEDMQFQIAKVKQAQ